MARLLRATARADHGGALKKHLMTNPPKQPPAWQTDFIRKIDPAAVRPALLKLSLEAVETIPLANEQRMFSFQGSGPFRTKMLLTLLTYCYGLGLYSSSEIEEESHRDEIIRTLVAGHFPDAQTLRRFRREYRQQVEQCLLALFRLASQLTRESVNSELAKFDFKAALQLREGADANTAFLSRAAHERFDCAIWVDKMVDY